MENKEKFDIFRIILTSIILIVLLIIHILFGENELRISNINTLIILPIAVVTYLLIAYDFFIKTFKNFKKKRFFDEITLTLIASIAAFCVNQSIEALAVALFFQIGEKFEQYAINKSRKSIKDVLDLKADSARRITYIDNKEIEEILDPYEINIDDIILVKPGEKVPLDGIVIKGNSFIDTSSLTGESVPRRIKENNEILSGVIVSGSSIYIKVNKMFYDSTTNKILDLVENATNAKTNNEKFITKFSKYYTPIVIFLAFLVAIISPFFSDYTSFDTWSNSIFNAASLLVVSCPCALVLSVPMAYFVGIGEASKIKAIIKGSSYLEKLAKLDTLVLDKTGTLTKGNFVINEVNVVNKDSNKEEIIKLAKLAEKDSSHPIAQSILNYEIDKYVTNESCSYIIEIEGKGIKATYKEKTLLVGNNKLLEEFNIKYIKENKIGTLIYVSYDNKYLGSILIKDEIKESSKEALINLKRNGIKNIYMLTGDNKDIASFIANELNIDHYSSNLLPLDKVNKLKEIKENNKNKIVSFVGDGINDAPSMAVTDLAVSMGNIGSDAAIEASDIVIMDDNLLTLNKAKTISKKTLRVVYENIIFALIVKFIALILASINAINNFLGAYIIWISIFADVGVTVLCVLNSIRIMKKNK